MDKETLSRELWDMIDDIMPLYRDGGKLNSVILTEDDFDRIAEKVIDKFVTAGEEQKFSLNVGLCKALVSLYKSKKTKISELGLSKSQYTNFAQLKYWGLIDAVHNEESKIKKGHWKVTKTGENFIKGVICLQTRAHRKKGIMTPYKFSGEYKSIGEIDEGYKYYRDYANEKRESMQDTLFNAFISEEARAK